MTVWYLVDVGYVDVFVVFNRLFAIAVKGGVEEEKTLSMLTLVPPHKKRTAPTEACDLERSC